jgi:crotonobetainyl-CoA:carnitine CoA-transferase CaiB-like acyl-CoA transferase
MIGKPAWGKDPRFVTFKDRLEHRPQIQDLLDEALSARTTDEWLDIFGGRVPAAPIYDVQQALENPFVAEGGKIQTLRHQDGSTFRMVDAPFRTGEPTPDRPGPELGEDTEALLQELGMDATRISALRKAGVV